MTKTELNELLKAGDNHIAKIKEDQEKLVENYMSMEYDLHPRDILNIKGVKVVVYDFITEHKSYSIKIRYKRMRYTGVLDNMLFSTPYVPFMEKVGVFNGKL